MKRLLITLLSCAAIVGQSKDELKEKYGAPVSETFIVRPGIGVTATYTSTGQITELLIAPYIKDLIKSKNTTLNSAILKAIIDELVPSSERGKAVSVGFLDVMCLPQNDCVGTSEDYEKLVIYYNAGSGSGVSYAVVQWK